MKLNEVKMEHPVFGTVNVLSELDFAMVYFKLCDVISVIGIPTDFDLSAFNIILHKGDEYIPNKDVQDLSKKTISSVPKRNYIAGFFNVIDNYFKAKPIKNTLSPFEDVQAKGYASSYCSLCCNSCPYHSFCKDRMLTTINVK